MKKTTGKWQLGFPLSLLVFDLHSQFTIALTTHDEVCFPPMASVFFECEVDGPASADEEDEADTGSDLEGFVVDDDDAADDDRDRLHARFDAKRGREGGGDDGPARKRRRAEHPARAADAGDSYVGDSEAENEGDADADEGDAENAGPDEGDPDRITKAWNKRYEKYRLTFVRFTEAIQWPRPYSMENSCILMNIKGSDKLDKIRSAYKRLCMILHPDKNRCDNADAQFKVLQQAYNVVTGNSGSSAEQQPRGQKQSRRQREQQEEEPPPPPPPPAVPVREVEVTLELRQLFEPSRHTAHVIVTRMTRQGDTRTTQRAFTITVPAGVPNCAEILLIKGAGDYDSDLGKHGDVRFVANVLSDPDVTRLGHNLEIRCSVKLHQVLNPRFRPTIRYLDREIKVHLPPTAWHGQRLTFPDKGLPTYSPSARATGQPLGYGSLFVKLTVARPSHCPSGAVKLLAKRCTY